MPVSSQRVGVPGLRVLRANLRDFFVAAIHFKSAWTDEFLSFALMLRFRNPRGAMPSAGF